MEYKKACKLLDSLVEENDERADVWYALAMVLFKLDDAKSSRECLKNAKLFYEKFKLNDKELLAGI